ncbi:MAG: Eco57I restriction-modification methylase domain-containing protein [Armatimonadota bacterium]
MPNLQQLTLELPAHRNQQLFSDHYQNLRVIPQWLALREQARPVMEQVAAVLADYTPSNNERQTEDDFVVPVLKLLGHTFEVQASLRTPDGTKKPDYVFYSNAECVAANKNQTLTDDLLQQGGIAVGDAKYWNRPLDIAIRQSSTDALSNKNPSYQISYYMQHSGVAWGILTNGKLWRLYHKDSAHKLDNFYEVDLEELVQSGDVDRFLYFYAFFRREAFDDGPLSAATILQESADYARNVGNSLKIQVYDALRHIAQGFLDYPSNGMSSDPDVLKSIYDNSLILLYRLIFILYAEARELLPVRESIKYRDTYSLYAIKRSVAHDLGMGRTLLPTSTRLWPQLKDLFDIINLGNPPLKVATFNGGLFDPNKHDFLARYTVGDGHLQQAIDKLARVGGAFVDYRDLSVRHMGTIYEGLLEYRLQPLSTPEDGWAIELVNDKGERKATGSYYTPDYIVKYIVEQAVGPVLKRAIDGKGSDADKLNAVLKVNVLDPAMGSGHFLVEATEYIARFLVDLAVLPEGKTQEEADLAFWKRRVVQSCVYGVDLNPLAVELAKLSLWLTTVAKDRPLSFLDHHLRPGNSLIGARLEHLDFGATKRKSRGKSKSEREQAAGQISLFDDSAFRQKIRTAVGSMWLIEENEANSVEQVKEQERLYEDLRAQLIGKYSRLLDLVTATQFGLGIDDKQWTGLVKYATGSNGATFPAFERLLQQADDIAARERFFHWELEFPEIYFDKIGRPLHEEGGFEAVVGNPPYVRQEQLAPYKPYLQKHYSEIYHGAADLYTYFFARGVRELQRGGLLAYISSGMFRRLKSGALLRAHLSAQTKLEQLVDFGDQQVFDGAVTYPIVAVLAKRQPGTDESFMLCEPDALTAVPHKAVKCSLPQSDAPWVFLAGGLGRILNGWDRVTPLKEFISRPVHRGVTTGCNEAFVINQGERDQLLREDPKCAEVIKPFLRGECLHPWCRDWDEQWLIFTRRGINIDAYPSIKRYLGQYREQLEPRPSDWNASNEWPGRKPGTYEWYEIQDSVDYYPVFEKPRIHSTKVSLYPAFSMSMETCYAGNTSYVIPVDDLDVGYYLLGLLNTRICEFFCRSVFSPKANGYYEVQPDGLGLFPVPTVSADVSLSIAQLARQLSEIAPQRYSLQSNVHHRLQADLGTPDKKLNQKLTSWWKLDFSGLRTELNKVFKTDIPVNERDEWEAWFDQQRTDHQHFTDEIIRLETELNERVYALFDLTVDEIQLVEKSTKYQYGEV